MSMENLSQTFVTGGDGIVVEQFDDARRQLFWVGCDEAEARLIQSPRVGVDEVLSGGDDRQVN